MSPFGGSPKLLSAVREFLQTDDWKFSELSGRTIIQLPFRGKSGSWMCFAQTREEKEQFIFYSVLQNNVPEDKRLAVSEFLTRANYSMMIGNFEMDFKDGEVRFKTSVDVEGGKLTPTMIKNMIYTNILMMDKYLPGLNKVIFGNVSPANAIEMVEK